MHITHSRPARILAVLLVALSLTACKDSALKIAAIAIQTASISASIITAEVDANACLPVTQISPAACSIDPVTAARLRDLAAKLTAASEITAHLTDDYKSFPAGSKPALHVVIAPLVTAFRDALDSGLTGIKNPVLQMKLRATLEIVTAGLAAADSILGGR